MVEECEHCNALFRAEKLVRVGTQCKGAFTSRMLSASLLAGVLDHQA